MQIASITSCFDAASAKVIVVEVVSPVMANSSALARGIFILVFAYGFFVLVERPSHKWAREFSKSEMLARIGRSYSGKLSFTE